MCNNTIGSRTCACNAGYSLHTDGVTCTRKSIFIIFILLINLFIYFSSSLPADAS